MLLLLSVGAAVPTLADCGGVTEVCSGIRGPPVDAPLVSYEGRVAVWRVRTERGAVGAVPCLTVLVRGGAERTVCTPGAERVVEAWAADLAPALGELDTVVVWVVGLDVVAVSPLEQVVHAQLSRLGEAPPRPTPPFCSVLAIVGADGTPLAAAARACRPEIGAASERAALARRYCPPVVCGRPGPVAVSLPISEEEARHAPTDENAGAPWGSK